MFQQMSLWEAAANVSAHAVASTSTAWADGQLPVPISFTMPFLSVFAYVGSLLLTLLCTGPATTKATSINLPSYPLAVKHPYLSTWVPGNQLGDIATARSQFWAGQNLSWPVVARIDGSAFALFGVPDPIDGLTNGHTESVSFTSSHTIFDLTAGNVQITLDFFSPVLPAPEDYARQSLPYSYLTVSVSNPTEKDVRVQIAAGIDQTWTNQNGAAELNFTKSDSAQIFQFHNPNEILFTETNEAMATYGTVVWSTTNNNATSHASGTASDVFAGFAKTGVLTDTEDGPHNDLAALSSDLGSIPGKQTCSVTFAVGFDRTDAIDYLGNTQTGYYRSQWPTIPEAVEFVLEDYANVESASQKFDKIVRQRSEAVSDVFGTKYADIIEASVRQTFGALELTVSGPMFSVLRWLLISCTGPQERPFSTTLGLSQRDLK